MPMFHQYVNNPSILKNHSLNNSLPSLVYTQCFEIASLKTQGGRIVFVLDIS